MTYILNLKQYSQFIFDRGIFQYLIFWEHCSNHYFVHSELVKLSRGWCGGKTLDLCLEVPGLNFDWASSVSPGMCQVSTLKCALTSLFQILTYSPFTLIFLPHFIPLNLCSRNSAVK